jgi:UDP-N-acetylmuramoylalanine--D-glutamate ligase
LDYHHAAVPCGFIYAKTEMSAMNTMQGQSVLVLGLGASGLAMAHWCVRCGAQVTVADTREAPPQLAALKAQLPQVKFIAGAFSEALVRQSHAQVIYKSPGLSPVQIAPILVAARADNTPARGELDLYSEALQSLQASKAYAPKVVAITGTNGKTTVTSLTTQLIERAGWSVVMAGNIGPSLLDTLANCLDRDALPQVWVLELSSFQLDGVEGFDPNVATVLNLSQDHLDWHGNMAAYAQAKARVFGVHTQMLLNRDDAQVMAMLPPFAKGKPARDYVSFGVDAPQRAGDYGIEEVGGMSWLVRAHEADETQKRRKPQDEEIHIQRLMPADALRIRGRHNATNALAALALAQAVGVPISPMLHGLREYRGEPHRVESVAVINDVEYFDDSKGTNIGATVAALQGLGVDRCVVIILGGDGKGQDFSPLVAAVTRFARAVVLIGRDAPQIQKTLQDTGVPMYHANSLPEAVQQAAAYAQTGDAVLMSPACASFDMFDNYEHRARVFCDAVQALAVDAGVTT